MDTKIKLARPESEKKKRAAWNYLQELKDEIKKVTWTSKDELKLSTKMVIAATFIFGLGIYLSDLLVKGALDIVHTLFHRIFG